MTRIEILNIRLGQLSDSLETIENRRRALWYRRKQELSRVLDKYFNVSDDKFYVETDDTRAYLCETAKGRHWELVTFSIEEKWSREEDKDRGESVRISSNGYRYENLSQDILDETQARFEFMQCAVDHQDDILAEWNSVSDKYDKLIDTFYPKERELRKAHDSQANDIRKLEEEAMIVKLTSDGVEFSKDNRGNLPELKVKWDWTLSNVAGLRVTRTSSSGKSADIQITQKFRNWNNDQEFKLKTVNVDRVRLDKVNWFLRTNKELIK